MYYTIYYNVKICYNKFISICLPLYFIVIKLNYSLPF